MGKETKPLPVTYPLAYEIAAAWSAKLEPGAIYLACFDANQWYHEKIAALRDELRELGITLVTASVGFVDGEPGVKFLYPAQVAKLEEVQ